MPIDEVITVLYNDPKSFREDMLKGYVAAYPGYVTQVPGGVARATRMPVGKVAVINGGGSGPYPAFCGIVGDGFIDGTVVGNVFASYILSATSRAVAALFSCRRGYGIKGVHGAQGTWRVLLEFGSSRSWHLWPAAGRELGKMSLGDGCPHEVVPAKTRGKP